MRRTFAEQHNRRYRSLDDCKWCTSNAARFRPLTGASTACVAHRGQAVFSEMALVKVGHGDLEVVDGIRTLFGT